MNATSTRVRVGGVVLVAAGALMAVGVFVPSVHLSPSRVANRPVAAEADPDSRYFSSWDLFTRCGRRTPLGCEIGDIDAELESDINDASVPHGLPLLVIAALLCGVGILTSVTAKTNWRRALAAWGGVVGAAIAVGFTFAAVDGTMRDFDVGYTTSGIWVLVTATVVAIIGAPLITRFEEYGSPNREPLATASAVER